ncbi:MAG TPA: COX15/CtaA family protein [Caulobacteraceae bacterium]|jgi:cytochrome c oxidase assembly protein subunit 15
MKAALPERSKAVALWLFAVAALVFAMVIIGGATRLTGSGLSITEWKPVTGAVPPLSAEHWAEEFGKYRRIPQYRELNAGMTLAQFQAIYWWEWAHRFLGRAIGAVFALPFLLFLAFGRIPRRLIGRCLALFALGGLQGLIGWWMVASGLVHRVEVAPERLTVHLGVALAIFCLAIWTGLEAWSGLGEAARPGRWKALAAGFAGLVLLQILLGGLVAGNDAGLVFNDWPWMNGRLFPADYLEGRPLGLALLHSQAAVQFNHRLGAYAVFGCALLIAWGAARSETLGWRSKRLAVALAGLVTAQLTLGIATLMARAPLGLSLLHQATAAVLLATAVAFAWQVRRREQAREALSPVLAPAGARG